MPIRINLKELFSSDSQGITIDKINFNFNKLLELGVGLEGDQGIQGPQGAAGPQGPVGPKGDRGILWFVGTGDPNGSNLPDAQDNDFYLDIDYSEIWQYNMASDNWNLLVDFGDIINNYLILNGSTFVRGVGETSPSDDRFIVFPNRGNNTSDQASDTLGGSSNNDILFLNNFNERAGVIQIDNFPADPTDLYNAIQKIYVDATSGVPGRYHLELGSLFTDTNGSATNLLSDLKHNTKFRHVVDVLGGSPNSNFRSSNNYVYITRASMSKTEAQPISELDFNSMFEFITSKYNNEGASAIRRELTVRLGSAEALGEYWDGARVDGISFNLSNGTHEGDADIGIVRHLSSNNQSRNDENYFALGYGAGIEGIMLTGNVYQDGGKIEQLGSDGAIGVDQITNRFLVLGEDDPTGYFHNLAIASFGNRLYTAEGRSPVLGLDVLSVGSRRLDDPTLKGAFYSWNIQEGRVTPNAYSLGTGRSSIILLPNQDTSYITGAGICDMVVDGEYAYVVHNQINTLLTEISGSISTPRYHQTNLQIIDLGNNGNRANRVNGDPRFDSSTGLGLKGLDGAWRIGIFGNYLVVGTSYLRNPRHYLNPILGFDNTILENGRLVLVDRSDLRNPVEFTSGILELRRDVSNTNDTKRHVMDMRVYDKYIITIELEFVEVTNITGSPNSAQGGYQIRVNMYDIFYNLNEDGPGIRWVGSQLLESDTTPVTAFDFNQLTKTGVVETDGQYIYAAFKDKVYVINFDKVYMYKPPIFNDSLPNTLGVIHIFNFTDRVDGTCFDIKVAGNSIYLLSGDKYTGSSSEGSYRYDNTYLTKINISNPGSIYNEWEETLRNGGTRFEIVGNKAYIASQTYPSSTPSEQYDHGIETIELDGIVSDHANLSNLRSDQVKVMSDLEVGNSAKIGTTLSVGQGLNVGLSADIGGVVRGINGMRKTIKTVSTNNYTIAPEDAHNIIRIVGGSAKKIEVTEDSLKNIGETAEVDHWGSGTCSVDVLTGSGVDLRYNANYLPEADGQYSRIMIQKMSADEYRVFGELKKDP